MTILQKRIFDLTISMLQSYQEHEWQIRTPGSEELAFNTTVKIQSDIRLLQDLAAGFVYLKNQERRTNSASMRSLKSPLSLGEFLKWANELPEEYLEAEISSLIPGSWRPVELKRAMAMRYEDDKQERLIVLNPMGTHLDENAPLKVESTVDYRTFRSRSANQVTTNKTRKAR